MYKKLIELSKSVSVMLQLNDNRYKSGDRNRDGGKFRPARTATSDRRRRSDLCPGRGKVFHRPRPQLLGRSLNLSLPQQVTSVSSSPQEYIDD